MSNVLTEKKHSLCIGRNVLICVYVEFVVTVLAHSAESGFSMETGFLIKAFIGDWTVWNEVELLGLSWNNAQQGL